MQFLLLLWKTHQTHLFLSWRMLFSVWLCEFFKPALSSVNVLVLISECLQVSSQSVTDDAWELWVKGRIVTYLGQVMELWISTCHWYDVGWMNLQIQSIVIQSQSVDHSTNKLFEFRTSRHQVHVQTKYFSSSYRGRDRVMERSRKGKMNINFNKFLQVLVKMWRVKERIRYYRPRIFDFTNWKTRMPILKWIWQHMHKFEYITLNNIIVISSFPTYLSFLINYRTVISICPWWT